jgi:transcriptional regulator with XRE-family HTH domain
MDELTLKSQLRLFLEMADITLAELSRRAKVPKSSLSDWLNGSSPRNILHVRAVSKVLGTSIDVLMFGQGFRPEKAEEIQLDELIGDKWVSGLFEVKLRRVKR